MLYAGYGSWHQLTTCSLSVAGIGSVEQVPGVSSEEAHVCNRCGFISGKKEPCVCVRMCVRTCVCAILPPPPQALLHPYFFTPPLPAHHSELPVPPTQKAQSHKHMHEFDVDAPLQGSLPDPVLFRPSTHFKMKPTKE